MSLNTLPKQKHTALILLAVLISVVLIVLGFRLRRTS